MDSMPRVAKAKAVLTVLLLTASVLTVVFGVNALSGGVDREKAGAQQVNLGAMGCQCHNPAPNASVDIDVAGIPTIFEAGQKYPIWVNFTGGPEMSTTGSQGGFNAFVSAGKLTPAEADPQKGFTQKGASDQELTHTSAGARNAQRSFNFIWDSTGAGDAATFTILANSVNGNGANDPADQWNRVVLSTVAAEVAPDEAIGAAAGEHVSVHKLGVNFLAYWVGVISFALLFIVYGATFFLFKYGESNATTDHFDRPDAQVAATKPVLTGSLWLLVAIAIIAAIVVFALLRSRELI